jgi:hypothetical protein
MPAIAPIRASAREVKRERPIPKAVRLACHLMIYGDDAAADDAPPLSFVAAAKLAGIAPYTLRRWLDKPAVIALIRSERAIFRRALCAGNELALAKIRDYGQNDAARVRSVLALEAIDDAETTHGRVEGNTPGIVISIISAPEPARPVTIDAMPPTLDANGNPVFDPRRR